MVRKKDRFWEHVEKQNNGRFKCKYCESIFAGGATRIKYHLAGAKGHDINICTKVPKEVQEEASLTIGEPNKKLKGASTSNKDKEREISSTSLSKDDMLSGVFEKTKAAEYIAEILLGVFVEGLLAKLRSIFVEQHISFELGFKEGLIDLFSLLTKIQLVLHDVEKRQASDEFLRSWLADLRRVAYDIDDVLDEFGYNILQQKVLYYSSPSNDIINIGNKIKNIYKSLNSLKGDIGSYEFRAEFENSIPEISFNMEIDSFLDDSKVNQNVGNNTVKATYFDRVIEITETFTQYELAEYDCWLIFKKRAFAKERHLALDLEKIGKEIVKKCKRVPWAAEFLGRIMYFVHDKGEWLSIQNNKNWDLLDDKNNGAFHILKIGYDHLQTPSLKRCFAYCAIFPKDCIMKKDEVIQCWMAEGFLEPSKEGNTVMEDIGNTYVNILLATSFFQNAREDAYGDIISCKMHNLVHDFAISISKSEILILEGDSVDNVSKVQPLFVRSYGKATPRTSFSGDSFIKMRTLISKNLDSDDMLSNFKCLRVLKLSKNSIIKLPNSIEQLIHLRLLHICTEIEELPKSITKLYNLQTLRIEKFPNVNKLPEDLSNLINLRHISIYIDHWSRKLSKDCLLKNMACLTSLQTLKFFSLGQDEGYRIQEIGPLKNLREIDIYNLEKVTNEEEAKTAKLKEKEILKLGLYWEREFSITMDQCDKDEKVLEGLHPHPNLKSLTIEGYRGKKFPSWVNDLSLFHNLIHIKLYWCIECEEVPTLGQLPCLRVLEIEYMHKVRNIGCKFYSYSDGSLRNTTTLFPALRILKLERMRRLEEWKDAKELTSAGEVLTVFPSLEELTLRDCTDLRYLPGVPSVIRHLEIRGCGIDELPSGLQFCTSLQYLKIGHCANLKSIPESLHTCVSLQKFVIQYCSHLSSLPGVPSVIQHLEIIRCGIDELPSGLHLCTSLQYLKIGYCPNLKSIPDLGEVFHSLIHLKISKCPDLRLKLLREGRLKALVIGGFIEELDAFPILRYPFIQYSHASLKKLILVGRPTLNSLPNEIQLFTALEELQIENFNGMEALPDWFSYLSSLQKLVLYHCKKLMYLPILHLTNLKDLRILHCRNLEKRYAEGSGPEWLQIAHVPNIRIDGERIQGNISEDSDIFYDSDEELDDIDDSEDDYLQEDCIW